MMIREKLVILKQSNMLEQSTVDSLLAILDYLITKNIIDSEDKADFFITHLAMACMRNNKKEYINFLEDDMREEIIASEHFLASQMLWRKLKKLLSFKLYEAETDYIYLHLVNFLNAR
ncbi:PRD domain-containing protein [Orbus sturtevantii]|uniref:PRD domain-containing protein n=1 Tax=Orbus sturtevantii TaxID=3074109 RepID=UPI00370D122C